MQENADQNNSEYWHILRILKFFVVAKAFDNFVPELISIRWNMALTLPSYSSEKLKIEINIDTFLKLTRFSKTFFN